MITYEEYIISKSNMLSSLFRSKAEVSTLMFIKEIDKWDWEVESIIESYSQLYEVIAIVKNAKKRVGVKDPNSKLTIGLNLIIRDWNALIKAAAKEYAELSEEEREELSDVSIDFRLYKKKS